MELNGQVDVFAFLKEQEVEEVEYKKEIKEEAVDVTLYEMTDSFLNISNLDTMSESEKENIKQVLMKEIASKSSNIIKVIRNKEAQIEQIDNEIKRLTELKKVKQNDINSIKGYTIECLNNAGIKKLETALGNITVRVNPKATEILDVGQLPSKYKKEVTEIKIDKKLILEDLKNGIEVEGATLKETTYSIILK